MLKEVKNILDENNKRIELIQTTNNPITGEKCPGERELFTCDDFFLPVQYIPSTMSSCVLIYKLRKYGSIKKLLEEDFKLFEDNDEEYALNFEQVMKELTRLRSQHDFLFWAAMFVYIKPKLGGEDIKFILNRAQRKLLAKLEEMRLAGKPIRLILLKARQWGGSTLTQIYMSWIQLLHKKGWNSIIVGHIKDTSLEVKGMLSKMMERYPLWMIDDEARDPKIGSFEGSQNIDIIHDRNCKVKVGTAEKPESARGGDSAMAHCTEVALWTKTDNKTPEQVVKSVCAGIPNQPLSMKVYESTANGTGNYFAIEWDRAKRGESDMTPLFIPWFEIDMYSIEIENVEAFATKLYQNKDSEYEDGQYNWWLWNLGATLEAINWYINARKSYKDHADMASEFPSDDIEAFKHSGSKVFNIYQVEALRSSCREPIAVGDLSANAIKGKEAFENIKFVKNKGGIKVWQFPDKTQNVSDRYLVIVDIGGRSKGSDPSCICVIDRYWMMDGDKPEVVAEWHGHMDHDLLAWHAAQIATWYNKALLAIESNTLETKFAKMKLDGNQAPYILEILSEAYSNLYCRTDHLDNIIEGAPRKFGWHTNTSTKPAIISNLIDNVRDKGYVERDMETLDEYVTYEKKPDGSYGAIIGKHDDKLITRAIGLWISSKMSLPKIIIKKDTSTLNRKKTVTAATL